MSETLWSTSDKRNLHLNLLIYIIVAIYKSILSQIKYICTAILIWLLRKFLLHFVTDKCVVSKNNNRKMYLDRV